MVRGVLSQPAENSYTRVPNIIHKENDSYNIFLKWPPKDCTNYPVFIFPEDKNKNSYLIGPVIIPASHVRVQLEVPLALVLIPLPEKAM